MLSFAIEKYGVHFPITDLLMSDPYAVLTKGATSAFWVGRSVVDARADRHVERAERARSHAPEW